MKTITPQLGIDSFSCPHCGAIAHQDWYHVFISSYKDADRPSTFDLKPDAEKEFSKIEDQETREGLLAFAARVRKHPVTYFVQDSKYSRWELINNAVSRCYSCKGFAIWVEDKLLYPSNEVGIIPHEDIPNEIRDDFLEAAAIVDKSPRSAAALLRLCIQKLMLVLEVDAKDLNEAIKQLVQRGLDKKIQQALDVVRVIGNNAVHPGEIDLKDDKATASQLFSLINLIVATMISATKQLEEMYASLPSGALEAIKKRDGK